MGDGFDITRAEVATLLNNVLNRHVDSKDDMSADVKTWSDNPEGTWFYYAMQEASNSHYYERKADGINEIWTEVRDNPHWVLLEKTTSTPYDIDYW